MTVAELISELRNFNPKAKVHFSYDFGDHWHTRVAPEAENVDEFPVKFSAYHDMPTVAEDEDEEAPLAVVISA